MIRRCNAIRAANIDDAALTGQSHELTKHLRRIEHRAHIDIHHATEHVESVVLEHRVMHCGVRTFHHVVDSSVVDKYVDSTMIALELITKSEHTLCARNVKDIWDVLITQFTHEGV